MKYKFRAECVADVYAFREKTVGVTDCFKVRLINYIPDVVVTFKSYLGLDDIIAKMQEIEDGHVMYQTVRLAKEYTGNREDFDF